VVEHTSIADLDAAQAARPLKTTEAYTASFSSFAGRKATFLLAL
jgi:hypothetical protein